MNLEELGHANDTAEQGVSARYGKTIGIVLVKRPGRPHDDASALSGDDPLDGVIAHVRDMGWSLLVTYWDEADPDACPMDALPDKVAGILADEGGIPAPLLERLAARVPVVIIGRAPDGGDHDDKPRRLLGRRACARLIERIAVPGRSASAELVPGELPATSTCPPRC
jgi:DNA-binding LacI/PurR family transcriptional regulator